MKKVLFVGESWHVHVTEAKGFDTFSYDYYEEATGFIKSALEQNGAEFCHIPSHLVEQKFPTTLEGLQEYDAIMFSDVGANTMNLPMNVFQRLIPSVNKLELVKEYVENDAAVKGIWCVPKYQNPTGITFSDEVVKKFAALKPAAEDFRIFWDNAYCVHDLYDEEDQLLNILDECRKNGNEDMCYIFASTSKISFPGAGVAVMAMSEANVTATKKILSKQMIGPDKINQLRHVKYFKNLDGIRAHMKKHAALIAPKFEIVLKTFNEELSGLGIAQWTEPNGGYFISLDVMPGTAKKVHKLMADAGVVMTGCGATFPYGNDPDDTNLRIAPSYPSVDELKTATELLCLCVKLAALEKIIG